MSLQEYSLCVETQRCTNIFGESDHRERKKRSRLLHRRLSLEDVAEWHHKLDVINRKRWLLAEIHAASRKCCDSQKGGGGQRQNTPSSPQNTVSSGTHQSTGTSTLTSNKYSGAGGAEPPEDGRGKPPIPSHYRDHQGEGEDDQSDSDDNLEDVGQPLSSPVVVSDNATDGPNENPRCAAGVTCSYCTKKPKTVRVFLTGERRNNCLIGICVYCSQNCAEKEKTGTQDVIPVNLWNTETSSWRPCSSCLFFRSMPVTVCRNCHAYMCGNCSIRCKHWKGYYKCPHQCPHSSGIITVVLPACIAGPARLETVELPGPFPAYPGLEREVAGVIQRMSQDEQLMRHRRRQLEDENRRLEEANYFQGLFSASEVQELRPLVESSGNLSSLLLDESDLGGTTSGPPTEEFQPPTVEGGVEQECDDPVADEEYLSEEETCHQPQEVPSILPAPKESEVEDEDEGCEVIDHAE